MAEFTPQPTAFDDELQAWASYRQQYQPWIENLQKTDPAGYRAYSLSPQGQADADRFNGKSLSSGAHEAYQHGINKQVFNPTTGTWEKQKGYWDHPESWLQVAFGAGLGEVGALGAAGAIGGASSAGSSAAGFAPGAVGIGETAAALGPGALTASSLGVPATAGLGTAGAAGLGGLGAAGATPSAVAPLSPAAATTSSYGPLAGGYGGATTAAEVPASLAGISGGGAGAAGAGWTSKLLSGIGGYPGLASAGLGLGSAYLQSRAAKQAAQLQSESAQKALDLARETYYQTRADLAPYRNVGGASITTLGQLLGLGTPGDAPTVRPSNGIPVTAVPRNVPMGSFGVTR